MRRARHLWFCLGLFLAAQPFAAQAVEEPAANEPARTSIGSARVIVADVSAQTADAERRLAVQDHVRFRELISTAGDSAVALVLIDGTELAMGETAQVRLDEFVLSDGSDASLSLQVGGGALRFVTGAMPKPAYRIATPTAVLTVRGTVFDLAVGADGATYVAVDSGAVTVATARGRNVDVTAGQSLSIDAAGNAGLPRPARPTPAATLPAGSLAGMIADMDLTLAEHVVNLDDAALPDLAVLSPSRSLARSLRAGDLPGKPGLAGGGRPPGRDKDGRARDGRDRGGRGDKGRK